MSAHEETVVPSRVAARDSHAARARGRSRLLADSPVRRFVLATAGPALIVFAVLLVLRNYAFRGMISTQHGDILEQWLPVFDHLGQTLRSGHVPGFNPYSMAGIPFAPDPQTGWMYLPAMALFTALPGAVAIRWFLVLQPILAGLGVYWFLRGEGTNRSAATAGGLVMALVIADSHIGLELPFAGALAWTSLSLAAASRFVRAERWTPRLVWLALMALAWGQIAEAHLSHGLVTGTALLGVYLAYRILAGARAGRTTWPAALLLLALAYLTLPVVNLAVLLPRVAYLSHTTLGLGYTKLNALASQLTGAAAPVKPEQGSLTSGTTWVFGLVSAPGAYIGAIAAALSFAGLWSKRLRGLTITFLGFGAVAFVAAMHPVAARLAPHIQGLPFSDFYVHAPVRFRYGVVAVLPLLAGIGVHAWCEAGTGRSAWRRRAFMIAPGVAFWWVLNALVGRAHSFPALFLIGSVAALLVLAATSWRPALAFLIPLLLLVELTANGVFGARLPRQATGSPWGPNLRPLVNAADYMQEGTLARTIAAGGDGRYVTLTTKGQNRAGRGVLLRSSKTWAALGDQRSLLFGIQDAGGYNPTQILRYWEFVRTLDQRLITYNSAFFIAPVPRAALDLLQIRWLIAPDTIAPGDPSATPVAREGPWNLYELPSAPTRATLFGSWRVVSSPNAALRTVTSPGFDPTAGVVLERDPGVGAGAAPGCSAGAGTGAGCSNIGTAIYRNEGPGSGKVLVDATAPGVVMIRNPIGYGWHATLDGAPVPLLAADFVDQGVAVPAGHHVIALTYRDPSIGWGFGGTVVALMLLFGAAGVAASRHRRREAADLSRSLGRSEVSGSEARASDASGAATSVAEAGSPAPGPDP